MSNFSEPPVIANATKSVINLLRGWPHPSLLPRDLLHKGANSAFSDPKVIIPGLLYPPDAGFQPLREHIASWLTRFFRPQKPITAGRITITGGASQSLGCVLQVYTDPAFTRNAWFVVPCYMLAFRIFDDAGLTGKMRGVPEDEEGIDIDYLRREIQKSNDKAKAEEAANSQQLRQQQPAERYKPDRPWGKLYRHVIYTVPTFSNPSSKTMSLRRREQLVRLAREFDALVVCDDVYDFLQWPAGTRAEASGIDTAVLPRVVDVDRFLEGGAEREGADGFGNVLSNGSFSKLAGPGLRTGWVEGSEKMAFGVSQCGTTRSGGAPSHIAPTFLSAIFATGEFERYILEVLQPAYARRYRSMLAAIETHLVPLGVRLPQSDRKVAGGYFVWIVLPEGATSEEVAGRAMQDENLVVAKGELFEVPGDNQGRLGFWRDLRLCFAWEDEDKLAEGVKRLAGVIRRVLEVRRNGRKGQAGQASGSQYDGNNEAVRGFW